MFVFERIEGTLPPNVRSASTHPISHVETGDTHPFAIDSHIGSRVDAETLDLFYVFDVFHIGSITSRAKYNGNFRPRIDVVRGNQCACCVVDQCSQFNGQILEKEHDRLSTFV